jgi:16S rRNA (cytosine1402-N4)-methyltransferase
MLAECISWLDLRPDAVIVDGTVGGGGHAEAILQRTGPAGRLIGLDRDPEALRAASERLAVFGDRALLVHSSFRNLTATLADQGIDRVDGVLLDLGVSSHQLDLSERGFRFGGATPESTPLDMRMDQSEGTTAAEWLREASEEELQSCFQRYGELPGSKRLAAAIVAARRREPIRTAADLLAVIKEARIGGGRKHNPATLVFQAIRILINDELTSLDEGLDAAIGALADEGRIVVLAYHSSEDRIVKRRFRDETRQCICPPEVPLCMCDHAVRLKVLTRRPLRPGDDESASNPRARSARLRAAVRVTETA